MPRHPPNALTTLNRSHCQCSSIVGFGKPCPDSCAAGVPNLAVRTTLRLPSDQFQQSGYLLQPDHSDAIDVFDPVTLLELRRAAHLCQIFKTSFSRLNPVPRGQATVIRSFIRGDQSLQQRTIQSDRLPTYLPSFPRFRPARPSQGSSRQGSDMRLNPIPGSLQINLLFTMYAEQAALIRVMQTFISSKDISNRSLDTKLHWWS